MDNDFRGSDAPKGSFRGSTGVVIGRGVTGTDPDGPECTVCFAIGGGAHGGYCPNAGIPDPAHWAAEPPPGFERPQPEVPGSRG